MIILDTDVLAELMRPAVAPQVLGWLDKQDTTELFLTSITQAELLLGLTLIRKSKRRGDLTSRLFELLESEFDGRVLAFDADATRAYARICADLRSDGRHIPALDAQIAAIAQTHGAGIATRRVDEFRDCGVDVVNPWLASSS
jgi:predicted nucleic acid-binding protein